MDWPTWAAATFQLEVSWPDFYVTNAALVLGAIAEAELGWQAPSLSLAVPALTVIYAVGFHIMPTVRQRRYSPGVLTASLLYLPAAVWAYAGAKRNGVLTVRTATGSVLAGVAMMAFPVAPMKGKARRHEAAAADR